MNALREQLAQVRQKPPTQGAALEALAASSKTNELEKLARRALAVGNSLNKSHGVYKHATLGWQNYLKSKPVNVRTGAQLDAVLLILRDVRQEMH